MNLFFEEKIKKDALFEVAKRMLVAARTAPKACGVDNLILAIAQEEEIRKIAAKMKKMAQSGEAPAFFSRDAENILGCDVLVLLATKISPVGVKYCGYCGFENCNEKRKSPNHPCAYNTGDLGIAIGSAVSVAMDCRVDNRVMYSVGMAVKKMKLLGSEAKIIFGIPLSSLGKNPFFDRK